MDKDAKSIAIILVFILALFLPFSNKAYHIDDTAFLYIANQIAKDPLRPYSFTLEWSSNARSASQLLDTPLVPYYIALISWIFGRSEFILHISFIIFPVIAGISFYFIAKKFIKYPLIASLIMLSTPTFLPNAQNLMLDVPMISLFLLATSLFIYGVDKNNHKLLFFASLAAGFAYVAKPNAIVITPLLFVYCFLKKKLKYATYLSVPVLFIILFAIHNYFFEDIVLIAHYLPFISGTRQSLDIKLAYFFSNLSYIGGATIFPLFLIYPFIIKKRNQKILGFSALISAIVSVLLYNLSSTFVSGKYTIFHISLFFIFIFSSIFFIALVLFENNKNVKYAIADLLASNKINYNSGEFFIFLWFISIYIFNSIISGGAVRYNTLFLPSLMLSYFIIFEKYSRQLKLNSDRLAFITLLFTALIGFLVAYADFEYANSYRDFVNIIPQKYKAGDNAIWFNGGWGFQYYMEEKSYRIILQNDNSQKKGDIVIKATLPNPRKISDELMKRLKLIETITYDGKIPVRTQNPKAHAGFYTYGAGFLPYSFSNSKLETFEIYQVVK